MSNVIDIRTRRAYAPPPRIASRSVPHRRLGRLPLMNATILLGCAMLAVFLLRTDPAQSHASHGVTRACGGAPVCSIGMAPAAF